MDIISKLHTDTARTIVGIGSALVDIIIHESDEFVQEASAEKGGMKYVDDTFIDHTISRTSGRIHIVPGGSACNTIVGVGRLGGKARFVGKLGKDESGNLYKRELEQNNVEGILTISSTTPTGRVLSIITPDAERSMLTYLGAASEMLPEDIPDNAFSSAAIVHVEGYLLFNRDLMDRVLEAAKNAGAFVSLDLAAYGVVEAAFDYLEGIVGKYVDILIANEDEAKAFTKEEDEDRQLAALAQKSPLAVLKLGKRGSRIMHNHQEVRADAVALETVVDTTGAGDFWAAGFLHGLVSGLGVERAAMLGSLTGAEVCRVDGASIPDAGWDRIKKEIASWNEH